MIEDISLVKIGTPLMVKVNEGWLLGPCVAMTSLICVVEIHKRNTLHVDARPKKPLDVESLSESSEWPPMVPKDFPLTTTSRGYIARINKHPTWICGRKSPRAAYRKYLSLLSEVKSAYDEGSHVAFPWDQIFLPIQAPKSVAESGLTKRITQWDYKPTFEPPVKIKHVAGLLPLNRDSEVGPCIYFLCLKGYVVYVGKTGRIHGRVCNHGIVKKFDAVFYFPCKSEDAASLESRYIAELRPIYNTTKNPRVRDALRRKKLLERIDAANKPIEGEAKCL